MAKLNLPDIGSLANNESARQAINDNFTAIETAIDNTVSRDGDVPNHMEADLDLNGNKVLNVADPTADGDAVNFGSVRGLVEEFVGQIAETIIEGTARSEKFIATASQTDFPLQDSPGAVVNMHVFDDGVALVPGEDFTLTGTDLKTLTFFVGRTVSHEILVRYVQLSPTDGLLRADLANPNSGKGSNLIHDKQSYTDAVTRTQRQKNSDVVSIADFGAVMDNVTDCRPAFLAAFACGVKKITIPPGIGYVSNTLTMPAGLTIDGCGATLRFPQGVNGINMAGANCRLVDITLDGTANDDNLGASAVILYSDGLAQNVICNNWGFHGFGTPLGGAHRNAVIGCKANNTGHRGINLSNGSTHNRITNFEARGCRRAGIILGYLSNYNIFENVYIDGHGHSTAGAGGLWIHMNCDYNIFRNFVIGEQDTTEQTNAPSVILGAGCRGNDFSGFILHDCHERGLYIWNQFVDHPELGTFNASVKLNRFRDFTILGNDVPNPSAGILFNNDDSQLIEDNLFDGFFIDRFEDAVRDNDQLTDGCEFKNFRFGSAINDRKIQVGTTADNFRTSRRINCRPGITNVGNLSTGTTEYGAHPAVPATGVAVTNPYPFPVQIFVSGLPAGGGVLINGSNANSVFHDGGNGTYTILPQQTITLSYSSGTPAWRWWGM